MQERGTWPSQWGDLRSCCCDLSPLMLTEARRKGLYDTYVQGNVLDILPSSLHAHSVDLVVAADVAPYMGGHRAPAEAFVGGGTNSGERERERERESCLLVLASETSTPQWRFVKNYQ